MTDLHWLPTLPDWRQRLRGLGDDPASAWDAAVGLANARLNFVLTNALDETVRRVLPSGPRTLATKPVRLAVLGSSHADPSAAGDPCRRPAPRHLDRHLRERLRPVPAGAVGPRLGTARLPADGGPAGAGRLAPDGGRHRRRWTPTAPTSALEEMQGRIAEAWRLARDAFRCPVMQQAILPVHLPLLGNNEHRLPGSRAWFVTRLNQRDPCDGGAGRRRYPGGGRPRRPRRHRQVARPRRCGTAPSRR